MPIALTQFPLSMPISVTQGFGGDTSHNQTLTTNPWSVDFAAPFGSSVLAVHSGTVVGIRTGSFAGDTAADGYGNFVTIQHTGGFFATYAHLGADNVTLGQSVVAGAQIATSGSTGVTDGAHIHVHFGTGSSGGPITQEGTGDIFRASGGADMVSPAFFAAFFGSSEVGSHVDVNNPSTILSTDMFGTGSWDGESDTDSDELHGSAEANRIFGGAGPDRLFGEGGDDLLVGGTGDDFMDGGVGTDQAVVPYPFGQAYAVGGTVDHLVVTGSDGADTFIDVESFAFQDGVVKSAAEVWSAQSPEIVVRGSGLIIEDDDNAPRSEDHTDFGSTTEGGEVVERTFTVRNNGTATLTTSGLSVPDGFHRIDGLSLAIAPGAEDTFTVRLETGSPGTKTGTISFTTNDDSENPFNFQIIGIVNPVLAPEIQVRGNSVTIADNDPEPTITDDTDFGSVLQFGDAIERTFTVFNTGDETLTTDDLTWPTGFILTDPLSTSIAARHEDTFTVRLETGSPGTKSGEISFTTNDDSENPFNFYITGTVDEVLTPEITVQGNGADIDNNDTVPGSTDHTDFGSTTLGDDTGIERTFKVFNTGTGTLTPSNLTWPSGFILTERLSDSIAAYGDDTFTVRLDTGSAGIKSGQISFNTNDGDENPFSFEITGAVSGRYLWSTLTGGQSLAFNAPFDVLLFDDAGISAAQVTVTAGSVVLSDGSKTVTLDMDLAAVTTTNISFENGSLLLVGDNTTGVESDNAANTLTGGTGNDQLIGLGGDDSLDGGSGNDILGGGSDDDMLSGGVGIDRMSGGAGNDTYIANNSLDVAVENEGEGTDHVQSGGTSHTLGANVENLTLTGSAGNGTGNDLNNLITGNSVINTLAGGSGNDSLAGSSGNDILDGGAGNDRLNGGPGIDRMSGGDGNDLYIANTSFDVSTENANEGTDHVLAGGARYTLGANIEHLTLTGNASGGTGNTLNNAITGNGNINTLAGGAGNDSLDGGSGNDILDGGAGNDSLDGGLGIDQMAGGTGNDVYIRDNSSDVVSESANAGTDTVESPFTYTLGANMENLVLTGSAVRGSGNTLANALTGNTRDNTLSGDAGNDSLDGGSGNDSLNGGSNNDTLNGGVGIDQMSGETGDDRYIVDSSTDVVIESASAGTDTVQSRVTHTLGANVENLVLTENATRGTGNSLANTLTGSTRNNTLSGDAGNDSLGGGTGNDTLGGGTGNDTLDGGLGIDRMAGGAGNDLYMVDDSTDVATEIAGEGTDHVESGAASHRLGANVENLTLTGSAGSGTGNSLSNVITGSSVINTLNGGSGNDSIDGGSGNDILDGGTGNDSLDGGLGIDQMSGGAGNDIYITNNSFDVVTENANEGTDLVQSRGISHTLGANVEHLTLTGIGGTGTGNSLSNVITGNSVINTLAGGSGNDSIDGGSGNDILNGGAGNDSLDGGLGIDQMSGGAGNDIYIANNSFDVVTENANEGTDLVQSRGISHTLGANVEHLTLTGIGGNGTGNSKNNLITGNSVGNQLAGESGNDTMGAGMGNDTLSGGSGNDRFLFDTALNRTTNVDVISDFNPVDDALRLDDVVFTGLALGTLAASAFRSGTQAGDSSDRIIYNAVNGVVLFDVDGVGGTSGVRFVILAAGLAITASDFIVV